MSALALEYVGGAISELTSSPSGARSKQPSALTSYSGEWLSEAANRLYRLANLPAGWDGHRAPPLRRDVIAFARAILATIAAPRLPVPHIVPLANGGLQLEWHERDANLELEITAPHRMYFAFEGRMARGEVEEEGEIPGGDISSIAGYLHALAP